MKWISVNDEMPPDNTEVLVWIEEWNNFEKAIYNDPKLNGGFHILENGYEYISNVTDEVTHWFIPITPFEL